MYKYIYPAVFTKEKQGYSIHFPDIESCYTQGNNLEEGIEMAEDVLALMLYEMEEADKKIPASSSINSIKTDKESFVTLIKVNTLEYRKMYNSKATKKTVTIPEWLNELALKEGVNFSKLLQEALMRKLNISR